jgi:hypothetical protein
MEYKDTLRELRPDSSINEGSPRILVVLLKNKITGLYNLRVQNNTFITRYGEGGMDPEAYEGLVISKGVLEIRFSFIRGWASYKFRMQNGDIYLIGGTSSGVSGGVIQSLDVNFMTRKARIETGKIEDEKLKVKWITIPRVPLRKLRDIKMIFDKEIVKDHYL